MQLHQPSNLARLDSDCQVSAMAWWGWKAVGLWVTDWLMKEWWVCREIFLIRVSDQQKRMAFSLKNKGEIKISWCHGHRHPASSLWGLWSSCKLVPCRSQCIMAVDYVPRWGSTEGRFFLEHVSSRHKRFCSVFSCCTLYAHLSRFFQILINVMESGNVCKSSKKWMMNRSMEDSCGQLNHWNYGNPPADRQPDRSFRFFLPAFVEAMKHHKIELINPCWLHISKKHVSKTPKTISWEVWTSDFQIRWIFQDKIAQRPGGLQKLPELPALQEVGEMVHIARFCGRNANLYSISGCSNWLNVRKHANIDIIIYDNM